MEQEVATQVVGLGGTTDFSLIQLFFRADFIVKSVIIILIAASIFSWALIFEKYRLFKRIEKSTTNFEDKFWKSRSAENFYNNFANREKDPVGNIFQSAMVELIKTKSKSSAVQSNRVTRVIEISADKEMKLIEKHFNLIKTHKDASRTKVIEVYPEISAQLSRKKDSNKADAILIARYFSDTQL